MSCIECVSHVPVSVLMYRAGWSYQCIVKIYLLTDCGAPQKLLQLTDLFSDIEIVFKIGQTSVRSVLSLALSIKGGDHRIVCFI